MEDAYDIKLWDQHFTSNNFTETVDNFWALILIFVQLKSENNTNTYDNHKDYILAQVKKKEMTVGEFKPPLWYHNHSVLPLLPGAQADQDDAILSDQEFKALFYKVMPCTWRDKFEDFHTLNQSALLDIKTFVERQRLNSIQNKKRDTSHGNENVRGNGGG